MCESFSRGEEVVDVCFGAEDVRCCAQKVVIEVWDLHVDDDGFGVALSFSDVHEKIHVPFSALISFLDPHVKFGLQFTPEMAAAPVLTKTKTTKKKVDNSVEKTTGNVVTLDTFRKNKD